jgi:hypothetical protein
VSFLLTLWGFLGKLPVRFYEYLGIVIIVVGSVVWYTEHERGIGEAKLEAEIQKQNQEMQSKIDEVSTKQNQTLQAQYNASQFKPFDFTLPSDCGSVPDNIRLQVNKAHGGG